MVRVFLSIFLLFFFTEKNFAFGQENITRRERVILATLYEQSQERKKALVEAFKKAGTALVIETYLDETNLEQKPTNVRKQFYVQLATKYDDNIYLLPQKKSDMITNIHPGFKWEWAKPTHRLALDAYLDYNIYANNPKLNDQDGTIDITGERRIGEYHTFRLNNVFYSTSLAPGEIGNKGNEFIDYWSNASKIDLEGRLNRIGYRLTYNRTDYKYASTYSERNDYAENIFTVTQYLKLLPKTWFLFDYAYKFNRYVHSSAQDRNSNSHEISIGMEEQLAPKLFGVFRMGYEDQKYKSAADVQALTFWGDMKYLPSDRTQIGISLQRENQESASTSGNFSVNTIVWLHLIHVLRANPKFTIELAPGLEYSEYPGTSTQSGRCDANLILGSYFSYAFREWLFFGLDYVYRKKVSSKNLGEFTNNVFGLRTKATF